MAVTYASSSSRFTSASTRCATLSETDAALPDLAAEEDLVLAVADGHRADRSLMPNCVTMRRAIAVARSMSLPAPVVIFSGPKIISSAARPPYSMASWR
jgi:hypothetical protein